MLLVKTYLAPSPIHGIGLFAAEDIPKDTVIWRFDPEVDRTCESNKLGCLPAPIIGFWHRYAYLCRHHGTWILCGDDGRFFNHSDKPNTYEQYGVYDQYDNLRFGIDLAAVDVRRGEELTTDYFGFDMDAHKKLSDATSQSA